MKVASGLYIDSITFNDGNKIELAKSDIVVLVGANNAGKSVTLKDIGGKLFQKASPTQVVTDITINKYGEETEFIEWFERNTTKKESLDVSNPTYRINDVSIVHSHILGAWQHQANGLHEVSRIISYRLTTEDRLKASNPAQNIALTKDHLTHPIHYLQKDDTIESRISTHFRQAFGVDLIVHRNAGNQVPLYCGQKPTINQGEDRVSRKYLEALEKLAVLQEQGDGMRAFVGVLLHTLVVDHFILLIDEPEAFLHPPQARLLGRMLAKEIPDDRQVFLATHSGDFLKGLLDVDNSRVRIVRINRKNNVNHIKELKNQGIKEVWNDPLLRYSNILDGLFHEKVIVGESDSDCRFYGAVADALFDSDTNNKSRKDVMFTYCSGKQRLPTVIKALYNLGVPVAAIADFDVLKEENPLRSIFEELGGSWSDIKNDWSIVKQGIEQKKPDVENKEIIKQIEEALSSVDRAEKTFPKSATKKIQEALKDSSPWSIAKRNGRVFIPSGDATKAANRLFEKLKGKGFHVVEVGELECFVKTEGNHGPAWVNSVLIKNLADDPELEEARKFVRALLQ